MARTADVVIMMLDATKGEVQRSAGWGMGQAHMSGEGRCVPELVLGGLWVLGPLTCESSGRTFHGLNPAPPSLWRLLLKACVQPAQRHLGEPRGLAWLCFLFRGTGAPSLPRTCQKPSPKHRSIVHPTSWQRGTPGLLPWDQKEYLHVVTSWGLQQLPVHADCKPDRFPLGLWQSLEAPCSSGALGRSVLRVAGEGGEERVSLCRGGQ